MDAKIEKKSELSKLLSVKIRMSDDLFHLFGKFGIGHLLTRLSLKKQDEVCASELILLFASPALWARASTVYTNIFPMFLCSFLLEEPVSRLFYLPIVYSV